MIKFRKIELSELSEYSEIFGLLSELYRDEEFVVYIADVDGKKNIMFKGMNSGTYSLFMEDNEEGYKYVFFKLNEENKIKSIGDDTYLITDVDKEPSFYNVETNCHESLHMVERNNGNDVDGYNGLVVYIQYNENTDDMAIISYQHMYNAQEQVYDIHLKNPFIFHMISKTRRNRNAILRYVDQLKQFVRVDFDTSKSMLGYKVFLLKEHGLEKFFSEKKYVIDRNQKESRYFRTLAKTPSGFVINGFPFMPHYTQEEMEERFLKKGFLIEVPRILLDCHNDLNENSLQTYCQAIVDSYLEYEKTENKEDVLVLSYRKGLQK